MRAKQSWPDHRHGSNSNGAKSRICQTTNPQEATALQTARDIDAALDLAKASDKWPCARTSTRSATRTGKISRQFLRKNRSDCRLSKRRSVPVNSFNFYTIYYIRPFSPTYIFVLPILEREQRKKKKEEKRIIYLINRSIKFVSNLYISPSVIYLHFIDKFQENSQFIAVSILFPVIAITHSFTLF